VRLGLGTAHADYTDEPDDTDMAVLLHKDVTERVLNSFYMVYDEHGYGFGESVYSRSLVVELQSRGVEVKATKALSPADEKQVLNYLKATSLEVGLLLNFGPKPSFRRLIFSQ
jgi:hypothetical protein